MIFLLSSGYCVATARAAYLIIAVSSSRLASTKNLGVGVSKYIALAVAAADELFISTIVAARSPSAGSAVAA